MKLCAGIGGRRWRRGAARERDAAWRTATNPTRLPSPDSSYKALKKLLKNCAAGVAGTASAAPGAGHPFAAALDAAVAAVDAVFHAEAIAILAAYDRTWGESVGLVARLKLWRFGASPAERSALALRAAWCRRFARVNTVGLRKIVKKYAKASGDPASGDLLQSYWHSAGDGGAGGRGSARAAPARGGAFLTSPLLTELRAVEALLVPPEEWAPTPPTPPPPPPRARRPGKEPAPREAFASPPPLPARAAPSDDDALFEDDDGDDDDTDGVEVGGVEGGASGSTGAGPSSAAAPLLPPALSRLRRASASMLTASAMDAAKSDGAGGGGSSGSEGGGTPRRQPRPRSPLSPEPAPFGALTAKRFVSWAPSPTPSSAGADSLLAPAGGSRSSSIADAAALDATLRCPICLDFMYRPLGLACGHAFCTECALRAVGAGGAVGSLRALLGSVDPDEACPECRRPAAFVGARAMRETGALVRARHPGLWAAKRDEARERAAARRVIAERRRLRGRRATPMDVLRPGSMDEY